jgi:hypothetical protein
MRKNHKIRHKSIPSYAVVADGDTEIWYLQMLKRNEKDILLKIKPEIPRKKSIEEMYNLVCKLSNSEYTKVLWIVDLDTIIKETKESKSKTKTALKQFIEFREDLDSNYKNVVTIVNNPCLEYWLLLHFSNSAKPFSNCYQAEQELKKHLKGYEKSQKFYTKQDNDIYLKLKPFLKTAVKNSESLGKFNDELPTKTLSEMNKLFKTEEFKKLLE